MAAAFDSTSDRLTYGTYTPPATGTVSLWARPTWAYNDGAQHWFFECRNAGSTNYWGVLKHSDNLFFVLMGGSLTYKPAASGLVQNAWNHLLLTWDDSANTRELFLAGSSLGADANAFNLSGLSESLILGNLRSDVDSKDLRGRLAEFAVWDAKLTAGEITALAKGFCPKLIRPASLKRYIPAIREIPDYKLGEAGTNSGVTVEDHPPIIYPRSRRVA